jgi:hypothetical protein
MSHTTTVSDIVISDVAALRSAITRLQKGGIDVELKENETPRAYYNAQSGMGKADFVVHLKGSTYDVGLYKNESIKGYEARTDFFGGSVQRTLGVGDGLTNQDKLGKLYQAYSVEAVRRQAMRQGYTVNERLDADTGKIQLRLA